MCVWGFARGCSHGGGVACSKGGGTGEVTMGGVFEGGVAEGTGPPAMAPLAPLWGSGCRGSPAWSFGSTGPSGRVFKKNIV